MEDMFDSPKLVLRDLHPKLSKSERGIPISSCLTFHFLLICFFVFLDSLDGPILSATFPRQTHHCRMELSQTCEGEIDRMFSEGGESLYELLALVAGPLCLQCRHRHLMKCVVSCHQLANGAC